ncbi:Cleft lip and palate associated transmembrane protein 1 [Dispira simplex]|nr:Cleft lip and palate associated transmembrane protein 1 [Dispira simplex]
MGLLGKSVTVVTLTVFALYMGNLIFTIVSLFFPTFYFPLYNPRPAALADPSTRFHRPYFAADQTFHAVVYVEPQDLSVHELVTQSQPLWTTDTPVLLSQLDQVVERNITVPLTNKNGQPIPTPRAYLTALLYPSGLTLPTDDVDSNENVLTLREAMIIPSELQANSERNLMTSSEPEPTDPKSVGKRVPHWKSQISLEVVNDRNWYAHGRVPADFSRQLRVVVEKDRPYLPLFSVNPMGSRKESLVPVPIGKSEAQLPLQVRFHAVPLGWFRLTRILDSSFAQLNRPGSALRISGSEVESLRKMVYEVNPTLLAMTIMAALLHMLFETLAVKSDIAHWSRKDNIHGISRSSVFMSAVTSWLTVLYIWDRRRDSGILVLGGTVVSAAVELWKVIKVRRFLRNSPAKNASHGDTKTKKPVDTEPSVTEKDRADQEFDNRLFKYLVYLCIPVMLGYATYSLFYWEHKGFYSWGLDTLMASIYLLGFVNMTPQLFLNHRLRSVEAMSVSTFLFRAINTFVDDLFALVIPMPGLTRVSAFRDDVIFVVLLYQWWKFPKRASSGNEAEEHKKTQ